jgi:aspartyl-tRNA(Asn)/glutamyl-tRNA(Gln) amidotransferase subunit C
MAWLVSAIWALLAEAGKKDVDACDNPRIKSGDGHDGGEVEPQHQETSMSVDTATVRRIAHLARIAVKEDEIEHLKGELNTMLAFVEQLSGADVAGVEPMTSVTPMVMKKRPDMVTDGEIADDIVKNAPAAQDHFFLVPKVVE